MIKSQVTYLVMSESEVLLYVGHSNFTLLPNFCLNFPVKEAFFPRPKCGPVDLDCQLFSPVTAYYSLGITLIPILYD